MISEAPFRLPVIPRFRFAILMNLPSNPRVFRPFHPPCAAGVLMLSLLANPGQAAEFTVTSAADSGAGSLRQALIDTALNAEADTVHFAPALAGGTIALTTNSSYVNLLTKFGPTGLVIDGHAVTLDGSDAPFLVISGVNARRVFAVTTTGNLTLKNITISGGLAKGGKGGDGYSSGHGGGGGAGLGGAVWVEGSLTVSGCTFHDNAALGGNGGAPGGVAGNTGVGGGGGGLGVDGKNGSAGGAGSAPGSNGTGDVGNAATGGFGGGGGGGVFYDGVGGTGGFGGGGGGANGTTVWGGTFGGQGSGEVNNCRGGGAGAGLGGAIFIRNGTCHLVNSTFTNNTATSGASYTGSGGTGRGSGGAVFNYQGDLSILNCTLHGNGAVDYPPNSFYNHERATNLHVFTETSGKGGVSIYNSILKGSSDGKSDYVLTASASSVVPKPIAGTGNIFGGRSSLSWYGAGSISGWNLDPKLGALTDNGGPTRTLLPGSGSGVIDQGDAAAAVSLTVDQRGKPRFAGSKLDIGAVQITLGPPMVSATAAQVTGLSVSFAANISLAGASAVTDRGFVWCNAATNANPLIGGTGVTRIINASPGIGDFSAQVSSLAANTAYVYKAYATNSLGTAYSGAMTFTTNQAPVITSNGGADTAAVTVVENSTAVTTVRATDPDVPTQQLSYAIAGGADAAKFSINATSGALTFTQAPDFEIAGDANADGVYELNVQAADNGNSPRTDSQLISVLLSDMAEAPLVGSPTGAEITPVRATLGGTVVHDGGAGDAGFILERGVVYALTEMNKDPKLGGPGVSKSVSAGTTGAYTLAAIELSPGSSYTYRPYAINTQGVSYGPAATFTTAAGPALTGDVWTHYAGSGTGVSGTANGTGTAAMFNGPKGITVDANGDPFVADTLSHSIRKIVGGTAAVSTQLGVAGTAGSNETGFLTASKFSGPAAISTAPGSDPIKYFIADTANHTVRLATWTLLGGWNTSTFAGTAASAGLTDATGATARFRNPEGIANDALGNVYLADTGNHAIRQINASKVVTTRVSGNARVLTWGGSTSAWGSPAAGGRPVVENAVSADICETHMIVALTNGTVDTWGGVIEAQEIPAGLSGVIRVAAGKNLSVALKTDGSVVAWGRNAEGQATVPAALSDVTAIDAGDYNVAALKSNGSVVVWGDATFDLNVVPESVNSVTAVAMGGSHAVVLKSDQTVVAWGNSYYGQTAVPAGLSGVTAIAAGTTHSLALKSDGTVVAWGSNSRGQCSVPTGLANVVSIAAGREFSLALKNDGTVVAWGSDAKGSVSVPADVLASGPTRLVAGSYHALAITAPLKSPKGVAADAQGNLYVADTGNHVIRKYTAFTGVVSVFAGSVGQSGSADGLGTAARFNRPRGISVDADGNVYVTDETDHTVRWITRDGIVRTLGGIAGTSGLANGAPEASRFKNPAGVASGSAVIYVADTGNNRIVKGTPLFRPIIGTAGASDVTLTSVTLDGWVNPNGKAATAAFEYGLTSAYGSSQPVALSANSSTSAQLVSAALSGLLPATVYHYRLTATNADGTSSTVDGTFSTAGPPVVAPFATVDLVGASSATLFGELISAGYMSLASQGFVYAETSANSQPALDGSGVTVVNLGETRGIFSAAVSDLNPGTAYSFRAYATNAGGTSYSDVTTFTTAVNHSPSAAWRLEYFGTTENTGDAADLATPDGDGIANIIKYALGLTPGENSSHLLPRPSFASEGGQRYLSIRLNRIPVRDDVTISVEAMSELGGSWTEVARSEGGGSFQGSAGISETPKSDGMVECEVRDVVEIGRAAKRFMRVRVVDGQGQ